MTHAQSAEPPMTNPPLCVELSKTEDRAAISVPTSDHPPQILLEIRSASGIGECVVRRTQESWPSRLTLRLHLRGLEQLRIKVATREWQGSVSSHDGTVHWSVKDTDRGGPETSIDETHPAWCPIVTPGTDPAPPFRVPLPQDGYWQATLPAQWLKDNPDSIRISWIDFFR